MSCILTILDIVITGFIAYHIFYLSKRLSFKDKLNHKRDIEEKIEQILSEVWDKKHRNRVYLVDVDIYESAYPGYASKKRPSHLSGAIVRAGLNGVWIDRREIISYADENGEEFDTVRAGLIPYEWIVDINIDGDSANTSPLIYCKFKNRRSKKQESIKRSPFKKFMYFLINKDYKEEINFPWEYYKYLVDPYYK